MLRAIAALRQLSAFAADPLVIKSTKSGPWSAASTWEGGAVPGAGARVLIREGHTITYDLKSDAVVRAINVAGTLTFAPDKDTVLNVGLIKIQPGEEYSEDGFDCEGHMAKPEPGKPLPALIVGTPLVLHDREDGADSPALRGGNEQGDLPGDRVLWRPDGFARATPQPFVGEIKCDRQAR